MDAPLNSPARIDTSETKIMFLAIIYPMLAHLGKNDTCLHACVFFSVFLDDYYYILFLDLMRCAEGF